MPNIRASNPFNVILKNSLAVFRFAVESSHWQPPAQALKLFQQIQAKWYYLPNENAVEVRFSHEFGDAFSGVFLVNNLHIRNDLFLSKEAAKGEIQGFHFEQILYSLDTEPECYLPPQVQNIPGTESIHLTTYTQRVIANILDVFLLASTDRVALAVCPDYPSKLTEENFLGNSMATVTLSAEALRMLCDQPKQIWLSEMRSRALRTMKVASRARQVNPDAVGEIFISSIGDLSRLSWVTQNFHPSHFVMVPTPLSQKTANLVLWSWKKAQAFVLCAAPTHRAWSLYAELISKLKRLSKNA